MKPKFDKEAGERITEAVAEIETNTNAELVIVIRARSGSYRHADYLFGTIVGFAGLLFALFSPFVIPAWLVPIDVALLFGIGVYVSSRSPWLRRFLTSKQFRAGAARTGAAAMFYEAGIANTKDENGLLVYVSLLEEQIEIIADRGILKAMPPLPWNTELHELKGLGRQCDPDKLIQSLRKLGTLLATHLPATGDNPNELVDGARIELK